MNIPHGKTVLGFLYAGEIESPSALAHHLVGGCIPEEFEIAIFNHFVPKIKIMFDIGANTGLYCCVAAHSGNPKIKIHAFEPQPDACRDLGKTIFLNHWEERLFIHQIGIGKNQGEMDLHLTQTGSSFDHSFNGNVKYPILKVPVDTLDNQAKQILDKDKIDFIKIDVEGFEQKVLDGGENIILRDSPIMFIEIAHHIKSRKYINSEYSKTIRWLYNAGYSVWKVNNNFTLTKASEHQTPSDVAMYLCLPGNGGISELLPMMASFRKQKNRQRIERIKNRFIKAIREPKLIYPYLKKKILK